MKKTENYSSISDNIASEKSENVISCEGLSFTYKNNENDSFSIPAVSDINIDIKRGDYVAVLGHNGSGKSTLAKLFNLILMPGSGALTVDGKKINAGDTLTEDDVYDVRKKVGMIFQNPDNQLVATIIEEDVAFGPENLGVPMPQLRERVDNALKIVGMDGMQKRSTTALSGGQKQRIAIAGVIAMKPMCIIFDESTAMLDPLGRKEVISAMERLNRDEGITVINITHYMEEAARANRVIVINDGKLYMQGTPREVFSRVDELTSAGLETPQCTQLLYKLNALGYDVPIDCIDPDECAEIISKLIDSEDGKRKNV